MNIRNMALACLISMTLVWLPTVAVAKDKPNIVYIQVDNWGWGDISIQASTIPTPKIDKLADQAIRFTNFKVQNQCTPTRSAIHTGRLPIRSGTQKVPAPGEPQGMPPWEYTIAELISDAGYSTVSLCNTILYIFIKVRALAGLEGNFLFQRGTG